ncbi:MAG: amidase [Chloroflexi bacterium]|nr:amidase [Chloroflexota bacterium]MBV9893242.1 amidase [Chloroflexota bacterium]
MTESSTATALHALSASEAAALIRSRQLSPVELVEALLTRAAAVDAKVQAWARLDPDRAVAAARAAEAALSSKSELGPLHGVPFGAKDIFDSADLVTSASFAPYNSRVPSADAQPIARLKAAGAILLGKMVTTQFAYADPSRTRNPWHDDRTPGGSSSGSAAGVAARLIPIAFGSQTAGSVLRPAAYNGVVGFKPTYGRVSKRGVLPLAWSLDHVGLLARSVADCQLVLGAIAGYDPSDPHSDPTQPPFVADGPRTTPPRLGLVREALEQSTARLREHVLGVAARFEQAGATIREVSFGEPLELILAVQQVTMQVEASAVHWQMLEQFPGAHQPRLRALVEAGRLLPGVSYLHAQRLRRRIRHSIGEGLRDVDALLLPTAVDVAPGRETTGDTSLQAPFSLVGFPSITLPSGVLQPEGLPLAVQLACLPWREAELFGAASWCEARLPAMPAPPAFA